MELETLTAISPIDGRYRNKVRDLAPYFSELGFCRYKVQVEIEYFIALCQEGIPNLKEVSHSLFPQLRAIHLNFSLEDGKRIKEIEKVTNHDVKAIEYFLKEKFATIDPSLKDAQEFIHFGLTSQDINNTAIPLMLKGALTDVLIPAYESLLGQLHALAASWEHIPMLARTHGQPASPTRLGKEFRVFCSRLSSQLEEFRQHEFPAKFGGATGNLNAHFIAYPGRDWHGFATSFVQKTLGLHRSFPTTQIEHYDGLARLFDNIKRINTLLTDLCVDCWLYISMDYFTQETVKGEIGSSAMPHKVNPIDFENAEGNFGLSTAICEFLSRKLPVSRLQRDLTDSTILRNVGTTLAHAWLAVQSLQKGLGKLKVNEAKIAADLDANWAVVAEAIQTILRREACPNPYETLLELTRGKQGINRESIRAFIESLEVSEKVKEEMRGISPGTYVGM